MKVTSPKIEFMPGFILMEPYDGAEMLSEIFGHYKLERFRESLWDFYKASLIHNAGMDDPLTRNEFTNLLLTMNNLATAGFLICEQQGKVDGGQSPKVAFFPAWQQFEANPWDIFLKTFSEHNLDHYRSKLWVMFTFAVQYTCNDDEQRMDGFIFLFERLNDLFTACYFMLSTHPVLKYKISANV